MDDIYCKSPIIHLDIVNKVKVAISDGYAMDRLGSFFKIMSDPTRLKIFQSLAISEMCVCGLSYALNMTQSSISHQLSILKQASLIKNRKDGKVVYYSLFDEHVKQIFGIGFEHINEKYNPVNTG